MCRKYGRPWEKSNAIREKFAGFGFTGFVLFYFVFFCNKDQADTGLWFRGEKNGGDSDKNAKN